MDSAGNHEWNCPIGGMKRQVDAEKVKDLQSQLERYEKKLIDELKKKESEEKRLKEEERAIITPKSYGWVCPVCGRGNAPWCISCPCVSQKYEVTC